jgi:hypothetical protein
MRCLVVALVLLAILSIFLSLLVDKESEVQNQFCQGQGYVMVK